MNLCDRLGTEVLATASNPIDYTTWPSWAELIRSRRKPGDIGVGSTFRRIADRWGGKQIKRISKALGMPCGCVEREKEWNRLYPYDD